MNKDWEELLKEEFTKDYWKDLTGFIDDEYMTGKVFPSRENIFKALDMVAPGKVRCVILGQDPYHDDGQAHGLAFSVRPGVAIPPSLQNIYKEISSEFGYGIPGDGCLLKWAEQGVLLLNTILTVRAHEPLSHKNKGWEKFTDAVIRKVNEQEDPLVFMLWGGPARAKKKMIDPSRHLVLEAPHPSPLSVYRGFYGCGHFRVCNDFLVSKGFAPIDWRIGSEGPRAGEQLSLFD